MPIPIGNLEVGTKYIVTRVGATEPPVTGTFTGSGYERVSDWPRSTRVMSVLVARIVNAGKEVGYNDSYTFELAAPGDAASATPAGPGFRAVRALKEGAKGQGRKTKKSKRRGRKTRRTRR